MDLFLRSSNDAFMGLIDGVEEDRRCLGNQAGNLGDPGAKESCKWQEHCFLGLSFR